MSLRRAVQRSRPLPRRRSAPPGIAPGLAFLLAAVMFAPGVATREAGATQLLAAEAPVPSPTLAATLTGAPSPYPSPSSSAPTPSAGPATPRPDGGNQVTSTLVLSNGSLLPGNFLPANGLAPQSVAVDPRDGKVFVVDSGSDLISVLNATSLQVLDTVPVGASPGTILYDRLNHLVYAAIGSTDVVSILNASTDLLVGQVQVGSSPWGLALDSRNGEIFVTNWHSANVSVINGTTDRLMGSISGLLDPFGIGFDTTTGAIYVSSLYSGNLTAINGTTWLTGPAVPLGPLSYPYAIAFDVANGDLYVTDSYGNAVSVVNGATNSVVATILVGGGLNAYPTGIAYDPANGNVYATSEGLINVSVIDTSTNTVQGNVATGLFPADVAFDSRNAELYAVNFGSNNVTAIDGTRETAVGNTTLGTTPDLMAFDLRSGSLAVTNSQGNDLCLIDGRTHHLVGNVSLGWDPIGGNPYGIAFDPATGLFYATQYSVLYGGNNLVVVDPTLRREVSHVPVGLGPRGVTYDGRNGLLYVADTGSNNVSVLDPSTLGQLRPINTSFGPNAIALDNSTGYLYVTDWNSNDLTVINGTTDRVVGSIGVGNVPYDAAVDPLNGRIYVANEGSDNVTILNGSTGSPLGSIPVGHQPDSVAIDPVTGEVYVANSGSDNVSVIVGNDGRPSISIPVGSDPTDVAWDPVNGEIVVANQMSGSVTFIAPATPALYPVVFDRTGLAAGTNWTVTLGATSITTSLSSLTFYEPNGTYVYTVMPVRGTTVSPAAGTLNVQGLTIDTNITFSLLRLTVAFVETGLPAGELWWVSVNGASHNGTTNTLTFLEPQGSYTFSVATSIAVGWGSLYEVNVSSGSFALGNGNLTVPLVYIPSYLLTVNAKAAGASVVSPGGGWYVWGSIVPLSALAKGDRVFVAWSGLGPGSYTGSADTGRATMEGPVNETAIFELTYTLSVTETGLPSGVRWSVTVNGATNSTMGSSMTFQELNGTYDGEVVNVTGYSATPSSFTKSVNGTSAAQMISFAPLPPTGRQGGGGSPGLATWEIALLASVGALVPLLLAWAIYERRRRKRETPKVGPEAGEPSPKGSGSAPGPTSEAGPSSSETKGDPVTTSLAKEDGEVEPE
ncbi:MAG: YncE family protein [Euryarchaeota archaeon]|nr:YncE family protein [Euryarchaeota archaeon]